jgi:hypothetical protein
MSGDGDPASGAPPDGGSGYARWDSNPIGGWYGLRKGYRGRFGKYLPPLLEALGFVELAHDARNNSVKVVG